MVHDDAAEADALARLEAALDRIAQGPAARSAAQGAAAATPDAAIAAARLDILISQLRDALATGAED